MGRVTGTQEKTIWKFSLRWILDYQNVSFVHKQTKPPTNSNTYFKNHPSIRIFLSSTKAGNYFNTGKRGNFKEINIKCKDSRDNIKVWSLNQKAWTDSFHWSLWAFISHPEIQSENRSLVIHLMAKRDRTWIHLAANELNMRLLVVNHST